MAGWTQDRRRGGKREPVRAAGLDWPELLLKGVDAALAGILFLVPLLLGGRHDVGRFAFAALAAAAGIAWFARQALLGRATRVPATVLAFLGCAALLVLVQLTPLPAGAVAWLAPRLPAVLPLWNGADVPGSLGAWNTVSVDPEATRLSLAMLAAYALLLVTVLERIETPADAKRLITWIGLSAGLMAVVGLVQYAVPNGKFLWVYDHPTRDAGERLGGAFANRNHFAHFLALGVPALAAWLMSALQRKDAKPNAPTFGGDVRPRRVPATSPLPSPPLAGEGAGGIVVVAVLLVVTCAAAILSCSRGGALALGTSASVIAIVLWRAGMLRGGRLAMVGGGALAVFLAIATIGYEQVADRLETLTADSMDELDAGHGRRRIWEANLASIRDGGLLGAGAGTHATVYPLYINDPPGKHYTHAESGYLQIVTENGVAGGVLLAAALLIAAGACWRGLKRAQSPEMLALAGAGVAALAASAVHSVCDFVWFIPACMATTLTLLACVWRLGSLCAAGVSQVGGGDPAGSSALAGRQWHTDLAVAAKPSRTALPWAVGAGLLGLFAVAQLLAPAQAASHWDAYLRMADSHRDFAAQAAAAPPADAAKQVELQQAELAAIEAMIRELQSVVRRRPAFALAHEMLAGRYVQLFNLRMDMSENRMPLSQVRDCAIQQQFASAAELREWLARATSGNHELLYEAWSQARQAAALAPLEGDPYVRLGELCFLQGCGFTETDAYFQQATMVRPCDGNLWFEIGAQWGGRGLEQWMLDAWARAFQFPGTHRVHIARALAGRIPMSAAIASLEPQWDTLPEFWRGVQDGPPGEVGALLDYAQQQAAREAPTARPEKAVFIWRSLAEMQRHAGYFEPAIGSLIEACRVAPDDYVSRKLLGLTLCDVNRFVEGAAQLRWCLDRRPDDQAVAVAITRINRQRLAERPDVVGEEGGLR